MGTGSTFASCSVSCASLAIVTLGAIGGALSVASWAAQPSIDTAAKKGVHAAFDHSDKSSGSYASWANNLDPSAPFVHFDM